MGKRDRLLLLFSLYCSFLLVVIGFQHFPPLHMQQSCNNVLFRCGTNRKDASIFQVYSTPDDKGLLEQMTKALGEKDDVFSSVERENKQLLQGLRDLDRDPNIRLNNRFIEWLAGNGVWVKTSSAWGRAPHPIVIASNTESDGESCGRGLLAREGMGEGELLMTIPLDICLTKSKAMEDFGPNVIDQDVDEYLAIALLLMHEKVKGDKSQYKPYLDILPDVESVKPSFVWSEEELEMLKGSPVYHASKSLRSKIEREYQTLFSTLVKPNPSVFPNPSQYSPALFLWAMVMLLSRAARLTSKRGGEELALVPYADLMNHNPYSNAYIDAQRSGIPILSQREEVAVYADRPYKKFEQVFINYGEKSNSDLLLLYGFALDRNPHDAVEVVVGLANEDPLYEEKKAILAKGGRGEGRGGVNLRFPLMKGRYPSELIDVLRLLLVEKDDLGMQPLSTLDFNEPLSPRLERRVLSTLIDICEMYIETYPTSIEDDEKLLKSGGNQLLTRTQRMAIKLRLSEKRILQQTIAALNVELNKLPKAGLTLDSDNSQRVQAEDTRVSGVKAAGRSFDPLNSTTKRREKALGELVETRGASKKKTEDAGKEDEVISKLSLAERRKRRRMSSSTNDDE